MTNYKLNDEKMFADITDGMAIIINSENGVYYGMNSFGTEILQNLLNGVTKESIEDYVSSNGADALESFNNYIDFLLKNEILILSSDSNGQININDETAKQDNYIAKVEEYLDAQELLLADPIHEVKEEEGWSPNKSSLNEDEEDVARREAKMVIINNM